MQRNERATGPLSEIEVVEALEKSGYPLELRLFEELRRGGMDPVFGFRSRIDDSPTSSSLDIDVVASRNIFLADPLRERAARVAIKAITQIKKIHDGCAVGFVAGDVPSALELRSLRAVAGGLPYWRAIREDGPDSYAGSFIADGSVGAGLDAINVEHTCVQWTVVKREPGDKIPIKATQDRTVSDDIFNVVRASSLQARDYTLHRLRADKDLAPLPDVHFYIPTLILEAPLYVYSPEDQKLTPVDAFSIRLTVDTVVGTTTRLVDVVSAAALPSFIARYAKAADAVAALLAGDRLGLALVASEQHERHGALRGQ